MNIHLCMLTDVRYSMTARVCMCMGLFGGVRADVVARVLGCNVAYVHLVLPELVRSGKVSRVHRGKSRIYHLKYEGRQLVRDEIGRVLGDVALVASRARGVSGELGEGWPRLDELEQMERELRKGMV